eukprot:CAMPEP_0119055190 /NCGR_PEP_ID=MMETSP1177-20130426/75571_1 /TAXON_ID=2985 /ORGANISM="Ochromonas sp, Strain CCMP1899" /LENGTH=110 /DNA_ID=CAMNT_0007035671 /DNA_START=1093 /DNA_END=1422 /DNA_ORIENTATION=+
MNFKNNAPSNNIDGLISEDFIEEKSDLEKQIDLENEGFENFQLPGIAIMKYKRYGECPPWYSTGRSCVTEISATRYSSMKKIPNYMRKIINEKHPDFIDDGLNNCMDDFR